MPSVGSISGRRLRRRPDIEPTLVHGLRFNEGDSSNRVDNRIDKQYLIMMITIPWVCHRQHLSTVYRVYIVEYFSRPAVPKYDKSHFKTCSPLHVSHVFFLCFFLHKASFLHLHILHSFVSEILNTNRFESNIFDLTINCWYDRVPGIWGF